MGALDYRPFYRRHLPHIQLPDATLFITFRLAGSIPRGVLDRLLADAERMESSLTRIADPQERQKQSDENHRRLFGKWDGALDTATSGPFWLRDPRIARRGTSPYNGLCRCPAGRCA